MAKVEMCKKEVMEILGRMQGCTTCEHTRDQQGYNESFNAVFVDDLLFEDECYGEEEMPLKHNDWILTSFHKVNKEDFDIYTWGQELPGHCIEAIKSGIDNGEPYYIAVFYNENIGTKEVLLWD